MYAQDDFIIRWRGTTAWRFPASHKFVYLLHFETPYHHAQHYMGYSTNIDARLAAHRHGNGSRLMEVITQAGISWSLARLWPVENCEQGHLLERRMKNQHGGGRFCPICQGKPVDALVQLRAGHWPLALHSAPGRRSPMPGTRPAFVTRFCAVR